VNRAARRVKLPAFKQADNIYPDQDGFGNSRGAERRPKVAV
jgi:hypothetical protein